jgi:branched-chain amino acid transport system permease protein
MNKLKTMDRTVRGNYLTYAFVIAAFVILSLLTRNPSFSPTLRGQLVPICAYVVMALSLNLTVGVLGELSLGHAGFMSVGAFSGAIAAAALQAAVPSPGLRLAIAMVIGAIFAGIVGTIISVPVLRLNGDYLAIVTLAFGEIIKSIINNLYIGVDGAGLHLSMLTDKMGLAPDGRVIIGGPMGISGISKISTFTAGFILVMVVLIVINNLVNSRAGRAIMSVRDNRIAAESIGISITKYKLTAFVISAAMAGMAGALFAMNFSTIVANKFDFNTSILILVFVVLGGLGNMRGSIIAAALLTILPELLRGFADYRMLIYAIVLILVMLARNSARIGRSLDGLRQKLRPGRREEGGEGRE